MWGSTELDPILRIFVPCFTTQSASNQFFDSIRDKGTRQKNIKHGIVRVDRFYNVFRSDLSSLRSWMFESDSSELVYLQRLDALL